MSGGESSTVPLEGVSEGIAADADGHGQSVDELSRSLQRFNWPDYLVFVLMLVSCIFIGIFFGYKDHLKHKNRKTARRDSEALDYLVGGRKMKIFPVAVSLVASWISGISLLGTSTEIYVYGTQYCYIVFAIVLMGFLMHYIFLPVFHDLQITSAYEYLQLRFDKRMRIFGSVLFMVACLLWMPIVIYVPALAFNQVTGINIHTITPIVCLICIFYTSVGGMKAVVWTDVVQSGVTLGALLAVFVKGTIDIGGPAVIWERNWKHSRIEPPNFDPDPTLRHSVWTLFVGGTVWYTYGVSCSQDMIQRYLSLPTLRDARKASRGFIFGMILVLTILFALGLLIFATYYECDPLSTNLAKAKDQLLPLFVMDIFQEYPGAAGVFVAGIFSAALSSLSSALNALAAIAYEDFCKPYFVSLSETQIGYILRGSVLVFGAISVIFIYIVEHLGAVMQLTMTLSSTAGGPLFGLFVMGILMPWVNATGALYGGIAGLLSMCYMCFRSQASIATGEVIYRTKEVITSGCHYQFVNVTKPDPTFDDMEKSLHHISYLYFTLFGTIVSCTVGTLTSVVKRKTTSEKIDPQLLAPFIRNFLAEQTQRDEEFPLSCTTIKNDININIHQPE
ncbi:sodium-coupled monocarboxylate transporter 1-like isoform X2 [Toxorhynchites rutilus septentrionalis]|uniref:sodium-coupled monocarboxylate transporter 1-like isoform X2 n=1 Tax=Toxorhynchites rutilus septentrionalis TaxID=329112 RepID=UPI0024786999|nr:sodium-coupled monocarboxylate transporter 1-like isoform X2 [Toxorhynchites rutilus septentrionalis]